MSSNPTPPGEPGAPDWNNVTLRTKQEIPKPTRFTPGWAAGIWCLVGAAIVAYADLRTLDSSHDGPILQAALTGLVMVLVAYAVGGITWRLRGREEGAGRAAFAIVVGLVALGTISRLASQPAPASAARDTAPLLNATAAAMKAHFETKIPTLDDAGASAEVARRLAAFDQAAAKENDPTDHARYATVRELLALTIASDLRVGAAIDALVATAANDVAIARDPAAMARMKAANAAFLAAAQRRYADDKAFADRIDTDLQGKQFSAAERESLQSLLRKGALAGQRITGQVTALVELTRATEAAYDFLVAHPGTWRVEDGQVRFNNGLISRDYAPFENEVERARDKLRKLAQ